MVSACQAWASFANAGPDRSVQERRWIAEMDRQWPNLKQGPRTRVQQYVRRWGLFVENDTKIGLENRPDARRLE